VVGVAVAKLRAPKWWALPVGFGRKGRYGVIAGRSHANCLQGSRIVIIVEDTTIGRNCR